MTPIAQGAARQVFDELSLLCRRHCADATRQAIAALVSTLRQTAGISEPVGLPTETASRLWENLSQRIAAAQASFDAQVARRLAGDISTNYPGADPVMMQLEDRITEAVCSARPHTYARFVQGVRQISPHQWQADSANPLPARVFVRALLDAIGDLLAPSDRAAGLLRRDEFWSDTLVTELGGALSAIYVAGESYLDVTIRLDSDTSESRTAVPDNSHAAEHELPATGPGGEPPGAPSPDEADHREERDVVEPAVDPAEPERLDGGSAAASGDQEAHRATRYRDNAGHADASARALGHSVLAGADPAVGLTHLPLLQPVADMERDAVAFAHAIGQLPYSRESRHQYFARVRDQLEQGGSTPAQLALVDLVCAIFDYVVDDRRLAEAARPLFWRLQQPALMLGLLDSSYLSDESRSVQRLVEHFGAIAGGFGAELSRGSELHHRMETVVRAFEVISNVLYLRANVLSRQVSREYDRCAASMTQLLDRIGRQRRSLESTPGRRNRRDYSRRPGRDEERLVTDQLASELSVRLHQAQVPESVRNFLEQVWLLHMRSIRLRDGQDSPQYQAASAVVDSLLWTLQDDGRKFSRRELASRIPGLIDELMRGMRAIGVREEDHEAFFDELFLLHLRRLQRQSDAGPADPPQGHPLPRATDTGNGRSARAQARPGAAEYDLPDDVPVLDEAIDHSTRPAHTDSDADTRRGADMDSAPMTPMIELPVHPHSEPLTLADMSVDTAAPTSSTGFLSATTTAASGVATLEFPTTGSRLTTQIARATTAVAIAGSDAASNDEAPLDNQLVNAMARAGLSDLPRNPRYLQGDASQVFDRIRTGVWVQLDGGGDRVVWLKVAWINRRRSMLLFIRHPDRRALSRSASEILALIREGRMRVLEPEQAAGF